MDTHERLYKTAEEAIDNLFADTTVDRSTTKVDLERLRDALDVMIDTLKYQ